LEPPQDSHTGRKMCLASAFAVRARGQTPEPAELKEKQGAGPPGTCDDAAVTEFVCRNFMNSLI